MTGYTEARTGQWVLASSALFLCGGAVPFLRDVLTTHYSGNIPTVDLLLPATSLVPFVLGIGLILHGTVREANEQQNRAGKGRIRMKDVVFPSRSRNRRS